MPLNRTEDWEELLQRDPTTLAQGYRIQREDGEVFCLTNRVVDSVISDSVFDPFDFDFGSTNRTYRGDMGVAPSEIQESTGLEPDNYNLQVFLDDDFINELDIQMRKFSQAECITFTYDYTDISKGIFEPRLCYLGETTMTANVLTFEVKALATKTSVRLGDLTSENCRNQFGDDHCQVDLDGDNPDGFAYRMDNVPITAVSGQRGFTCSSLSAWPSDFFQYGHIKFLDGPNAGLAFDVESFDAGVFTLRMPALVPFTTSHHIFAQGGCKKTWRACWEDHNNAINLAAEPRHPTPETANRASGG